MSFGHLVRGADNQLREWLENSKLPAGGRLPSERALARDLGLQHYAVNRAMARLIVDGTVERRGYKLFYNPRKEPSRTSSFSCDLVVSQRSIHLPGYRKVARELEIDLNVHPWQSTEEAVAILRQLNSAGCESVIFDPPFGEPVSMWEPATTRLIRQGIPVICISQPAAGATTVLGDNARGLEFVFSHLIELGHQDLAFLTLSPWAPGSSEVFSVWKSLCLQHNFKNSTDKVLFQNDSRLLPEDARRIAKLFTSEWSKVTGLIVFTDNDYPVQQLLDELERHKIRVPDRLSLAFVGDTKSLHASTPTVTATAVDIAVVQESAYLLAQRAIRKKREFGILPQPCDVRIQPRLIQRESTATSPFAPAPSRKAADDRTPDSLPGVTPFSNDTRDLEPIWHRPYDFAAKISESRFASLDLSPHVNRPLNFRRGWLGDLPLKHFHPGRHVLHGVPFEVLGGSRRTDCGAIIFQSLINTTGSAKKLPSVLRIEIDQPAAAVYFLHGCGYTKFLHRFATYSFFQGKKKLAEVPLVALGKPLPGIDSGQLNTAISEANIQDWWPDYPHYDFPHGRIVPLLENDSPDEVHRHVFLYTLEWVNPNPKATISHIEIKSDPSQSTTLGVLGISLLRPAAAK